MKKAILWVVGAFIAIAAVSVVVVGLGVGNQASAIHDALEAAVNQHLSRDQVTQKLASLGLSIANSTAAGDLSATGPRHSLLVYGTWLTVDVKFDPNKKANGYHLDRASDWF